MKIRLRDNLRYLLIIMNVVCWGTAVTVAVGSWQRDYSVFFTFPLTVITNALCSVYLYRRAQFKKVEWGLFGLLGNVTAILVFWLVRDVKAKWEKGERYFS
jgi:hypothetical protein